MFARFACAVLAALFALSARGFAQDDWAPYQRTGLFPEQGGRWIAPELRKETPDQFAARLLEGARGGDARAMATLGRFFYIRGDMTRAGEWLHKAALAGHLGAQLDYGKLRANGRGIELAEAYQWLWLATWSKEPGADAALLEFSKRVEPWQIIAGVRWAAEYQKKITNAPSQ